MAEPNARLQGQSGFPSSSSSSGGGNNNEPNYSSGEGEVLSYYLDDGAEDNGGDNGYGEDGPKAVSSRQYTGSRTRKGGVRARVHGHTRTCVSVCVIASRVLT